MNESKQIKDPLEEHIQREYEKVVAVCGKMYEKYPHTYQFYKYFRMGFLASDNLPFAYAKRKDKSSFLSGTEFVAKETIDRVCEWLSRNVSVVFDDYGDSHVCVMSGCSEEEFIEKFREEINSFVKL